MPPFLAVTLSVVIALGIGGTLLRGPIARWVNRRAVRAVRRHRTRIDRFKLRSRAHVRGILLGDARIREAVIEHAHETGTSEAATWATVEHYIREIVPFFNLVAYYALGYRVAQFVLGIFYKVSVTVVDQAALDRRPRDAVTVYLMNHRSNADYVLVGYALAGQVAISYAVGEWARAFPLEQVFKAFGGYFVRRRHRERLYHTVLERYVQLITREGVTQGIFLEGGLTRDGKLRPTKIGLLDYVLGIGREAAYRDRIHVVPVAVNYDRVLEDRSLLRELAADGGGRPPGRVAQLREVTGFLLWNAGRVLTRRWKRYGRAAVVIGAPIPLAPWYAANPDLFALEKPDRLARVQALTDDVMQRIGAIIPVTPVPLVCAALQTLGGDLVSRAALVARIEDVQETLRTLGAQVLRAERTAEETLEVALRMLVMRRVLLPQGEEFVVLPRGRELVSYYANSVAHLLGPWEAAVRSRDTLPVDALLW